jgi:hypothetical protein
VQLDETRLDIPTPPLHSDDDHQPISLTPPRRSRRWSVLVLSVLAAAVTLLGVKVGADMGDASPADGDDAAALALADASVAIGEDEDAIDLDGAPAEPEPHPEVPPVPEDVGEEQPVPGNEEGDDDGLDGEPAHPCDLLPDGHVLAVSSTSLELPVGQYAGELLVTNCGEDAVQWSATTLAPSVQLGVAGGIMAAGATVDVQFAVDPSSIVGAKLTFFITIAEPGFDTVAMITVAKPILNPGVIIPNLDLQLDG